MFRHLLIAAATTLLVLAPHALASHAEPDGTTQRWDFHSGAFESGYKMVRDGHAHDSDGHELVTIAAGASALWLADEVALVAVDFSTKTFDAVLQIHRGTTLTVAVGYVDATFTTFDTCGSTIADLSGLGLSTQLTPELEAARAEVVTVPIDVGTCVIPAGATLATKIDASPDGSGAVLGTTSNTSPLYGEQEGTHLLMSFTQPGYPTPELPTLALASTGLVVLGLVARRLRS